MFVSTVGVIASTATSALAEDPSVTRAREYFRAGAQAYAIGEYAAAVQAFEQANTLAPRPAVLFSIAQAERRQYFVDRDPKRLEHAVECYRKYLGDELQASRKTDAVSALSELEPLLAKVAATSATETSKPDVAAPLPPSPATLPTRVMITSPAPGATIILDDLPPTASPLVRQVEAGEHRVHLQAPGFRPAERRVIAVGGELVSVDVPLAELPATLEVVAPPDAQLSIDGRVQGRTPFPRPIELGAGVHLVTVSKNGFIGISREETLVRGQTTVFTAPLRRSRQRTTALFMIGAGASALTAGGIFAWFAHSQESAARDFLNSRGQRLNGPEDLAQYESARTDYNRIRGAAWLSVGVGVGLGLTGAWLMLNDSGTVETIKNPEKSPGARKRDEHRLLAQPTLGPNFAGFGIQGAF